MPAGNQDGQPQHAAEFLQSGERRAGPGGVCRARAMTMKGTARTAVNFVSTAAPSTNPSRQKLAHEFAPVFRIRRQR